MKPLSIISTISLCLGTTAITASAASVSTRPGPFRLVTTSSPTTPVVSTGNVVLYYTDYFTKPNGTLGLFTAEPLFGTDFQLYNGVLGTFMHPDDTPGDLPYNATTPASNSSPAFQNQAVAHAGYDLIDNTFLAIHGVQDGKWSLCTDSRDGLPVITYEASPNRPLCQPTYIAVAL